MQVFTVYIFNERMRSDKKQGDLAIVVPFSVVDKYSVPVPGYSKMAVMAEAVYGYDIDEGHFKTYKNRQIGSGYNHNVPFEYLVHARSIWFMNDCISEEMMLNQLLAGQQTPPQMRDKKYCEISLAGLDNIALYLSVLSGYYGEDDESCSDI